jgi:hypothetical protein
MQSADWDVSKEQRRPGGAACLSRQTRWSLAWGSKDNIARDDGQRFVGKQVEVARDHAEIHLVEPKVGEDRQIPDGQHLVEILVLGRTQV